MERSSLRLSLLMVPLIFGTILGSITLGKLVHPGDDHGTAYGIIAGLSLVVTAVVLYGAAGWLLNNESTPQGRRWHNRYEIGSLPVQYASVPWVLLGWVIVCYNLGSATSAWIGWPVFVVGLVLAAIAGDALRHRRRAARRRAGAGLTGRQPRPRV